MAALEGGRAAVASASGMAAEAMALMTMLQHGDHVVAAGALYGGTVTMLAVNLEKFGVETSFVDATDPAAFAARCGPTRARSSPRRSATRAWRCSTSRAVADIAHAHGVPLVIDNTVPSPFLCHPIAPRRGHRGALGHQIPRRPRHHAGRGDRREAGGFPWDNGKFPGMTEPSPGYHGVNFYETFGDFGFTMRARMETLRVYGAALSPMSAWQILQGIETLPLRMERHCANALAVAEYPARTRRVSWVNYPGLPDHPQHALVQRQMRGASGCWPSA